MFFINSAGPQRHERWDDSMCRDDEIARREFAPGEEPTEIQTPDRGGCEVCGRNRLYLSKAEWPAIKRVKVFVSVWLRLHLLPDHGTV
jgi:hypothetical protein